MFKYDLSVTQFSLLPLSCIHHNFIMTATPRIFKAILGLVTVGLCSLKQVSASAGTDASPTVDLTMIAPWSAPNLLVEVA